MPWVNEVTKTFTTGKVYGLGGYSHLWSKITVKATTNGDTVNYTVTANCGDTTGTKQPAISLWVGVDSQTVVPAAYYKGSDSDWKTWKVFPLGDGTTKTGSITTTAKNDTKIPVSVKLLISRNYKNYDTDWDNSLQTWYLERTWYTEGGTPTLTISQTAGSNTATFSGNLGKSGTNNALSGSTLYYKINGASSYSSVSLGKTSGGSFSKSYTINKDCTASAYVVCKYAHGDSKYAGTSSSPKTKSCLCYSKVKVGSVSDFKDNGNNSFTITGTRGGNGSHNEVTGATLYWATTKNSSGNWISSTQDFASGKTTSSKTVSFKPSGTASTKEVAAAVVTKGKHLGSTDTGWITFNPKQYFKPYAPQPITLTTSKLRHTAKEKWTFSWISGGTPNSTTSPIKGYYINVHKKSKGESSFSPLAGLMPVDGSDAIVKGTGTKTYIDRLGTRNTVSFNPIDLGFKAGDEIYIRVRAYTQWGDGTWQEGPVTESNKYLIKNAGIVKIKTTEGWKEGQVWVKTTDGWKEAETVYIKTTEGWKESQ
jgi:hypothetical protein